MTVSKTQRVLTYLEKISRHSPSSFSNAEAREALVKSSAEVLESPQAGYEALEAYDAKKELKPAHAEALEAIIHKEERPAIDINEGTFADAPFKWQGLLEDARSKLDPLIKSVGRVQSNRPYAVYDGTAFVVGDNLLMTNRHVAEYFIREVGQGPISFTPRYTTVVDALRERGAPAKKIEMRVVGAPMIHPYWDMALLRVEGTDLLPGKWSPHILRTKPPLNLEGRPIALVGFPAFDNRNDDYKLQNKIFQGVFGVKRLLPGYLGGTHEIHSFGRVVKVLTHDATTLGGNSGSAVVDLETGEVLGLHFAGAYLENNYAIPAWELARDIEVRKQQVFFSAKEDFLTSDPMVTAIWRDHSGPEPAIFEPAKGANLAQPTQSVQAPTLVDAEFRHLNDSAIAELLERRPRQTKEMLVRILGQAEAEDLINDLNADKNEGPVRQDPDRPEIIFIHGIMGSHLKSVGVRSKNMWLSPWALVFRCLSEGLRLDPETPTSGASAIEPDGHLWLIYGKAARKWRRAGFVVHEFSYDWRRPIIHCADRLHHFIETLRLDRPRREFALVAHSMGGLVSSMYAHRHPQWSDYIRRAVFMGSPLGGSYDTIGALTGTDPTLRKLSWVARNDSLDDLVKMSATFPGLLDMLPNPQIHPAAARVYERGAWKPEFCPRQRLLDNSRNLKPHLVQSPLLARTTGLVSLCHPTIGSLGEGEISGAATPSVAGDGTVPGMLAAVDGLRCYEVDHEHAMIPTDSKAINAVITLLQTGTCELDLVTREKAAVRLAVEESFVDLNDAALGKHAERMQTELNAKDIAWLLSSRIELPKD